MKTEGYIKIGQQQHCASIAPHKTGVLIAFYGGGECTHYQSVRIVYWSPSTGYSTPRILRSLTGNPVIVSNPLSQSAKLFYSEFEMFPNERVKWWEECTTYVMNILYDDNTGKIELFNDRDYF